MRQRLKKDWKWNSLWHSKVRTCPIQQTFLTSDEAKRFITQKRIKIGILHGKCPNKGKSLRDRSWYVWVHSHCATIARTSWFDHMIYDCPGCNQLLHLSLYNTWAPTFTMVRFKWVRCKIEIDLKTRQFKKRCIWAKLEKGPTRLQFFRNDAHEAEDLFLHL